MARSPALSHASPFVWAGRDRAVLLAPAKVNLFLELHAKRPDGFHELATLLVTTSLFDMLEVSKAAGSTTTIQCDTPGVPVDATNLIARAAAALARRVGRDLGSVVRLTKRIPHAAGLGGGSADAAAMLIALDWVYQLNAPLEMLSAAAADVGSDVPAFLVGPAAWCEGRGEQVTSVSVAHSVPLVIVKPRPGLSTAAVYTRCTVPASPASGDAARDALASGEPHSVAATLHNRLADVAETLVPELALVRDALLKAGALAAMVSGSGSSLFAVCADRASARRVGESVSRFGQVFVTRTAVVRGFGSGGVTL